MAYISITDFFNQAQQKSGLQNAAYKNENRVETPVIHSAKDIYRKAYEYGSAGNSKEANELLNLYDLERSTPSSPYYNPYFRATNTQAINGLRGLGLKIPESGISQKYIDSLKPYASYDYTSVSGGLKAPSKTSTPGQDLAYWLYQLEQDEETTQAAENEWEEMQREINLYVKQGYSDDDIIRKIDMGNYPMLSKMDESLATKVPIQTTRGIGYSKDNVYGAIWAARNGGGSGNTERDFMSYAIGEGNQYVPDPTSQAARDASSERYNPYGFGTVTGKKATALANEYGVFEFTQSWLEENRDWLNGTQEQADTYRKIQEYVNTSDEAKAELDKLNEWADKKLQAGNTAEEIIAILNKAGFDSSKTHLETQYPTLYKMEEARKTGQALEMGYGVDFAMPYFSDALRAKEAEYGVLQAQKAAENGENAENGEIEGDGNAAIDAFRVSDYFSGEEARGVKETAKASLESQIGDYLMGKKTPEQLTEAAQGFVKKYPDLFGGPIYDDIARDTGYHPSYDSRSQYINLFNVAATRDDENYMGDTAYQALKAADDAVAQGLITLDDRVDHMMTVAEEMDKAADAGVSLEEWLHTEGNEAALEAVAGIESEISTLRRKKSAEMKQQRKEIIEEYSIANSALLTGGELTDEQIQVLYAVDQMHYTADEFTPMEHAKTTYITVTGTDEYGYEEEQEVSIASQIEKYVAGVQRSENSIHLGSKENDIIANIVREQMYKAFERDMKTSAYQGYTSKRVNGKMLTDIDVFYDDNPEALSWLSQETAQQIYDTCVQSAESFFTMEPGIAFREIENRLEKQYTTRYTGEAQQEALKRVDDEGAFYALAKGAEKGWYEHTATWAETVDFWILRQTDEALEAMLRTMITREEYRGYLENVYLPNIADETRRKSETERFSEYSGDIYDFGVDPDRDDIQNFIEKRKQAIEIVNNEMLEHLSDSEIAVANTMAGLTDTTLYGLEALAISAPLGAAGLPTAAATFTGSALTYGAAAGAEAGSEIADATGNLALGKSFGVMIGIITAASETMTANLFNKKLAGVLPAELEVNVNAKQVANKVKEYTIKKLSDSAIGKIASKLPKKYTANIAANAKNIANAVTGNLSKHMPKTLASFGRSTAKAAYSLVNRGTNITYQSAVEGAQEVVEDFLTGSATNTLRNIALGESNPILALDGLWDTYVASAQQMALLNIFKLPANVKNDFTADAKAAKAFAETAVPMQKEADAKAATLEKEAKEIAVEMGEIRTKIAQEESGFAEASAEDKAQFETALQDAGITVGDVLMMVAQPDSSIYASSRLMNELQKIESKPAPTEADIANAVEAAKADIANEQLMQEAFATALNDKAELANETIEVIVEDVTDFKNANAELFDARTEAGTIVAKEQSALNEAHTTVEALGAQRIEAVEMLESEEIPTPETVQYVQQAIEAHEKALEIESKAREAVENARKALQDADNAITDMWKGFVREARTKAFERVEAAKKARDQMLLEKKNAEKKKKEQEANILRNDLESTYNVIQAANHKSDAWRKEFERLVGKYSNKVTEKMATSREQARRNLENLLTGWKVKYESLGENIGGSTNRAAREIILNSDASLEEINSYVMAHELSHYAESSGLYKGVQDSVLEFAYGTSNVNADAVQAAVSDVKNEYKARVGEELTDADALHEVVANRLNDSIFRGTETGKWINSLLSGEKNLAQKVYGWVSDQVQALGMLLRNKDGEGSVNRERFLKMREIQKKFETALQDAGVEYEKPPEMDIDIPENDTAMQMEIIPEAETENALQNALLPDRRTIKQLEVLAMHADEAKAAGNDAEYARIMEERQKLIETTGVRYDGRNPLRIAEKLALDLGSKVYTLKTDNAPYFDQHSKAVVTGSGASATLSSTMQAVGEAVSEIPEVQAIAGNTNVPEFFFRYMTEGNSALSSADSAFRIPFEKALSEAGKLTDVKNARSQMLTYLNSTAAEKMNAMIAERYAPKQTLGETVKRYWADIADRTIYAQMVDAAAGTGNRLSLAASYLPYAKRAADRMIDGDMVDPAGNRIGEGLQARYNRIGITDKDYALLQEYMIAKHGLDRAREGKPIFPEGNEGVTMTFEEMAALVQRIDGDTTGNQQYARIRAAAAETHNWWNTFMDAWVVAEGRLSEDDVIRMRKTYPNYVPTFREGYGIRLLGGELSQIGSNRRVYNPIASMNAMMVQSVNAIAQNRFAQEFDAIYQAVPGLGWIAEEVQPKVETVETVDEDGVKTFETKVTKPQERNMLEVTRRDGTKAYYKVADEGLYNLLSGSGQKAMQTGLEAVGRITRFMARLMTELNPVFAVKNVVRDLQHSVNYGSWASNYATGLMKWLPAFFEVARGKSETYYSYQAMGGGAWERYRTDTRPGTRSMRRALTKGTGIRRAGRAFSTAANAVTKLNEWAEMTSRFVEYKYGKHDISTPEGRRKAFMAAQEATLDFQRGGDGMLGKVLRQIVPFFNATIQGTWQQARMFTAAERERLAPRLTKTLINNALMGALSVAMVQALGSDEDKEKYRQLSDSAKNEYMILPIFGDREFWNSIGMPAGMDFWRIPLAQDALAREAYVFGNRIADVMTDSQAGGLKELAADIGGATLDILRDMLPSGGIWQPFIDVRANKTYYGSNIVNDTTRKNQHWTAWYDSTTPDMYKNMANVISRVLPNAEWAAPANLEYLTGQLFGWPGQAAVNFASKDYYTGETKGMRGVVENAFKAFAFDTSTTNDIRTDYDKRSANITAIAKTKDAVSAVLKPGLSQEEAKEAVIEAEKIRTGILKDTDDRISALYDEIRLVNEDESLTDFAKETQVAALYDQMVEAERLLLEATEAYSEKYIASTGDIFGSTTYVPKLSKALFTDDIFREDYEDGLAYMLDAEYVASLPGNENKTTLLPNPKYELTRKDEEGVEREYVLDSEQAKAQFVKAYRDAYMYAYEDAMDIYDFDELTDEEKTTVFKKFHTYAQKEAQAVMWDEGKWKEK